MIDLIISELPDAEFRLLSVSWVDGTDNLADSFSATLEWEGSMQPLFFRLHVLVRVTMGRLVVDYGPYDLEPISISGEEAVVRISGRTGLFFEESVAALSDLHGLYEGIESFLGLKTANNEPWKGWHDGVFGIDGLGGLIKDKITEQIQGAGDLAAVRGVLQQWGMLSLPVGTQHRNRRGAVAKPERRL